VLIARIVAASLAVAISMGALPVTVAGQPEAQSAAGKHSEARGAPAMAPLEMLYANFIDAAGALLVIDSGMSSRFDGASRSAWKARSERSLATVKAVLARFPEQGLSATDRRALSAMRSSVAEHGANSAAPTGNCRDAQRNTAGARELRTSLYACFSSIGDNIDFEGKRYARVAALQLLEQIDTPSRRRALWMALQPLWQVINGEDAADSPYRRLVRIDAAHMLENISSAERSLGLKPGAGERWLQQALDAWAARIGTETIEPWDYTYVYSRAARSVAACAPGQTVKAANTRFFADLGADLKRLGVIEDLAPRLGKAPVDFTDFARIGRPVGGDWIPAIAYVSIITQPGRLSAAAELAHEDGHAVNYAAIRSRPSLALPDDMSLTGEAIADITGWSVFDPSWQRKYFNCAADPADDLNARLAGVIQDIAWGLFEIRMAHDPGRDPNALWTEITGRYLRLAPHSELSWWAIRGQLVDDPGYMLNYALGAFVTADLRARIGAQIGAFDAGNPRWYAYLSANLFRYGGEMPPDVLLKQFLGRPVSNETFMRQLAPSR
jgi:hypothetical protein